MKKFKLFFGVVVWGVLALPMISLVFTSYVLAPLIALPIFVRKNASGRENLVSWLYWFQTFDNPVDEGYYGNYGLTEWVNRYRAAYEISTFSRYAFRVYWLWRNSVYGFARYLFGVNCTGVSYVYYRAEKDFFAVSDGGGWFTPFQLRGLFLGVYVYIGWKLTKIEQDGGYKKMYCIQINPFRRG